MARENRPRPAELAAQPPFRLVLAIDVDNPLPFLKQQFCQLCPLNVGYLVMTLGVCAWLIACVLATQAQGQDPMMTISFGLVFTLLVLMPLHELVHAGVLRYLGAPDIRFSVSWRQVAVMTMAHNFVVADEEWFRVAIAPFLVINGGLLAMAAGGVLPLFCATALAAHMMCCGGDVAHIARHHVTPDEVEEVCHGHPEGLQGHKGRILLIGLTQSGRVLAVVLEPEEGGAHYPVTARPASRKEQRYYQQQKGGVEP